MSGVRSVLGILWRAPGRWALIFPALAVPLVIAFAFAGYWYVSLALVAAWTLALYVRYLEHRNDPTVHQDPDAS